MTACDYSAKSIETIQRTLPGVETDIIRSTKPSYENENLISCCQLGCLHYNTEEDAIHIVKKLKSFKTGGYFVGTVRSNSDTHLKVNDGQIGLTDLSGEALGFI